jgi:hypothetical protein
LNEWDTMSRNTCILQDAVRTYTISLIFPLKHMLNRNFRVQRETQFSSPKILFWNIIMLRFIGWHFDIKLWRTSYFTVKSYIMTCLSTSIIFH